MILLAGDVVLTRGSGLLSAAVRLGSEPRGSRDRARVNHAGVVSVGGKSENALVIESLPEGTVERKFAAYLAGESRDLVVVYRSMELSCQQRAAIVAVARQYVGRKYGWLRIAAIAGDWLTRNSFGFRARLHDDDQPVCSQVVAVAYKAGAGYRFSGCDVDDVDPDDIWDDVTTSSDWEIKGCA